MRLSFAALALGIAILAPPPRTMAAPVPEYRAFYRSVDGTAASTDVSSSYDAAAGAYTLVVKSVDDTDREYVRTLRFNLVDDKVRPLSYREENRRCASCTFTVRFDWDARVLQSDTRGEQRLSRTTERDGTPGPLVRDVAMLVAMLPGRRELAGFDDAITEQPLGTVELETPLGRVHAEGRAFRGTWDQTVWLAQELDLLPARVLAFRVTVELSDLTGIEWSAARGTTGAENLAVPLALGEPVAAPIPAYRAVYRLDLGKKVGAGQFEVAVTHDRPSDQYEFLVTAFENESPEEVLTLKMPFRLVSESVQPLGLRVEDRSRRPLTVEMAFDWVLHEASVRFDGRQMRYSLVDFDDRDERSARLGLLEPLAGLLTFLPGDRVIAGLDDLLTVEPLGPSEIVLPIGSFAVERAVLLGEGEDMSAEIWRARALSNLPVRFVGPLMTRKAATMELAELHGIERAATD